MKNYKIICVGALKEPYWVDASAHFAAEIRKYKALQIIEVPGEKTPDSGAARMAQVKERESAALLKKISPTDYVVALEILGHPLDTPGLAQQLTHQWDCHNCIVFVIGGTLGLAPVVLNRADLRISFSAMTFPHQMMRIILLHQLAIIERRMT